MCNLENENFGMANFYHGIREVIFTLVGGPVKQLLGYSHRYLPSCK
jgi:hypothetical protein